MVDCPVPDQNRICRKFRRILARVKLLALVDEKLLPSRLGMEVGGAVSIPFHPFSRPDVGDWDRERRKHSFNSSDSSNKRFKSLSSFTAHGMNFFTKNPSRANGADETKYTFLRVRHGNRPEFSLLIPTKSSFNSKING